jgi:hypothetical protein
MHDDDEYLLLQMISDYERRADEFDNSAATMRGRLNDPDDLGVLHSRDMVADFLQSYERRAHDSRRKAALLRRLRDMALGEQVDG